MVAIIYCHETRDILCGYESFYCFEASDDPEKSERLDILEHCTEAQAVRTAIDLSKEYRREIRYAEFQQGRTHFCMLTTNSHVGVIKGNAYVDEEPIHALQREVYEEIGILLSYDRLIHFPFVHGMHVYFVPVTLPETTIITQHLADRAARHCGELFHVAFRNLCLIQEPMNHITRRLAEWLTINELPGLLQEHPTPFTLSPLLPLEERDLVPIDYRPDVLYEPTFVWGRRRHSLLAI